MSVIKTLKDLRGNIEKSRNFIADNKERLIVDKRNMPKRDISYKQHSRMITPAQFDISSLIELADNEVFIVGNSCGFLDSHEDVSLKGSWTKTANERGNSIPIFKDHKASVDSMFAKNLGAQIVEMPIKALGFDAEGYAEVIGFKISPYSEIDLKKYLDNTISQHSMGLRYIKVDIAVNDPDMEEEYKNWQAYYGQVINKADVDELGYFWAVKEQKALEVSALPFASNSFTPAFTKSLLVEPSGNGTHKQKPIEQNNLFYLINSKL